MNDHDWVKHLHKRKEKKLKKKWSTCIASEDQILWFLSQFITVTSHSIWSPHHNSLNQSPPAHERSYSYRDASWRGKTLSGRRLPAGKRRRRTTMQLRPLAACPAFSTSYANTNAAGNFSLLVCWFLPLSLQFLLALSILPDLVFYICQCRYLFGCSECERKLL